MVRAFGPTGSSAAEFAATEGGRAVPRRPAFAVLGIAVLCDGYGALRVAGTAQGFGDVVEVVVEEVGVRVEGHRGAGMAEHPLHGLDVGACA